MSPHPGTPSLFAELQRLEHQFGSESLDPVASSTHKRRVRVGVAASLGSPSSDLQAVTEEVDSDGVRYTRLLAVLEGVAGTLSMTPERMAISVLEEDRLQKLTDVFHHRLITLYYRAWCVKTWRDAAANSPLRVWASAAFNQNSNEEVGITALPVLLRREPTAASIRGALYELCYPLPVRIKEKRRRRGMVPSSCRAKLSVGHAGQRLRDRVMLGGSVVDRRISLAIELGPGDLELLENYLPLGDRRLTLERWCSRLIPGHLETTLHLRVKRRVKESWRLANRSNGVSCRSFKLGRDTWLPRGSAESAVLRGGRVMQKASS